MSLFEFQLKSLNEIEPWGKDKEKILHWFGLTDGYFHMDVGTEKLFRLSDAFVSRNSVNQIGCCRFDYSVDYQVIRPLEDLMEILPDILQPIPAELFDLFNTISKHQALTRSIANYWGGLKDGEGPCDEYYDAFELLGVRKLSTNHLQNGPDIWFLNDGTNITIRWLEKDNTAICTPVWSSFSGEIVISKTEFISEVTDFHKRLMDVMYSRIETLKHENPFVDTKIDMKLLNDEQNRRNSMLDEALKREPTIKDWSVVSRAIEVITHFNPLNSASSM